MTAPHTDPTARQKYQGLLKRLLGDWRRTGSAASLNDDIVHGRGGLRTVMRLAWPSIFEMIMVTMVQYVDTAMVGRLGASAMAAVGLSMPMTWIINGTMMAISVGATVLVARHVGARQFPQASAVARQAIVMGAGLGLLCTAFLLLAGNSIPKLLGAQPDFHADAATYIRIFGCGLVPHFIAIILSGVFRGTGDTRTPMLANIVINLVNIVGNFFLIFPTRDTTWFGVTFRMPGAGWGVGGAASATAFASFVAGAMLFLILLRKRDNPAHVTMRQSYQPNGIIIRQVLTVGIPTAMERLVLSIGQAMFISLVASQGTAALAAHHLAVVAESFCYMPTWGFSMAATTLVGQCLGARQPEYARRHANHVLRLGLVTMTVAGIVLFAVPAPLMRFFTTDQGVIAIGVDLLRIIAFAQPLTALMIVLTGALRGAGDTKWPFYISIIGMWGVRLTTCYLFLHIFGWGVRGAWLSMLVDLSLRGLLFYGRWHSNRWTQAMERTANHASKT
ncbi:MAG: MATE family efflux transporter [Lentisphaeria bacterium]|nr:MATE family efflux transporter [Lentisphaeria bacterium]